MQVQRGSSSRARGNCPMNIMTPGVAVAPVDIAEIAETLFPLADKLILTKPKNPRSMEIEELRQVVPQSFSDENLYLIEETTDALTIAKEIIGENGLILITGSLYLIGEIQGFLKSKTSKV